MYLQDLLLYARRTTQLTASQNQYMAHSLYSASVQTIHIYEFDFSANSSRRICRPVSRPEDLCWIWCASNIAGVMLACRFSTKKNASPNAGKLMLTLKWNCHCIVHTTCINNCRWGRCKCKLRVKSVFIQKHPAIAKEPSSLWQWIGYRVWNILVSLSWEFTHHMTTYGIQCLSSFDNLNREHHTLSH